MATQPTQFQRIQAAAELAAEQIKMAKTMTKQSLMEEPSAYTLEIAKLIALNMSNSN